MNKSINFDRADKNGRLKVNNTPMPRPKLGEVRSNYDNAPVLSLSTDLTLIPVVSVWADKTCIFVGTVKDLAEKLGRAQ